MSDSLLGSLYWIPANSKRGKHGTSAASILDKPAICRHCVSGSLSTLRSWTKVCSLLAAEFAPFPLPVAMAASKIRPILQMIRSVLTLSTSFGYLYARPVLFCKQSWSSWDNFHKPFGRNKPVRGSVSACHRWEKDADRNCGSIASMWCSRAWAIPSSILSGKTFLA